MYTQRFSEREMNKAFEKHILNIDNLDSSYYKMGVLWEKVCARKIFLDARFDFSIENKEKIKRLNLLLAELSLKAYNECIRLQKLREGWEREKNCFNQDYEMRARFDFFCNQKHANTPLEGYSLVHKFDIIPNIKCVDTNQESALVEEDWNLRTGLPALNDLHFCHSLYTLQNLNYLSWEDIVAIDSIWVDVELTLQRFVEVKR